MSWSVLILHSYMKENTPYPIVTYWVNTARTPLGFYPPSTCPRFALSNNQLCGHSGMSLDEDMSTRPSAPPSVTKLLLHHSLFWVQRPAPPNVRYIGHGFLCVNWGYAHSHAAAVEAASQDYQATMITLLSLLPQKRSCGGGMAWLWKPCHPHPSSATNEPAAAAIINIRH